MVQGQVFLKRGGGGWHFRGFPIVGGAWGAHTPHQNQCPPMVQPPPQLKMKPHPSEKQTPPPPIEMQSTLPLNDS